MPDTLLLLTLVGLPFAGAIIAGLLPTHARNAAAGLAGAVALACLGLVWAAYPAVSAGGVLRAEFDLDFLNTHRAAWGFFRDRRPELYGALTGPRPA